MSVYDKWKKRKENNIYERWKREKEQEQNISNNKIEQNNSTSSKLLLPLLNQGETINIDTNITENLSNMSSGQRIATIHSITGNQKDFNKLNQETIQYQQQKDAQEKSNKINEDISNKKYGSAISHILLGIPQKALDTTTTTFAAINSLVSPNKIKATMADENELLKTNKILTSKYENTTSKINNDIVKTASNISGTIGGMVPSIISNIVLPGSGAIVQGVNVGAGAYQDTLNEDASNKTQATITGIAKGTVSGLIEKITGGNLIGKGSLDDVATNFIANKFKGKTGQWLASKAYEMIGEIGEENLENQAGYIIDKIINGKDITAKEWWNEATETTKNTFLTTIVLNLLGLGGSTYNDVKNAELDLQAQKYIKEAENIIKNENLQNTTTNLQQNQANNDNILSTEQTIQKQNQLARNSISEQTEDILNNKELPMQSYQYEQSDNTKINNLRQDANRYFNNSEKARNYVSMLEKIVTDKNIEIRLDGNLKTTDGRIVNGSYSNGVITINPNSTRAGEFIAIHELTHAIGTKEMLNMINTYRNSNTEFDTAVKGLLQNYQGTEISEEALADISGQLFGNQEFINNVAQNNPNIFQKIYSEIKYLWHQFRGYKNQNQFVEDLYYKWTQAYNSNNKLNETSKYSIAGIKAMTNAIKENKQYKYIEYKYNQAVKMDNEGKSNKEIIKRTGWYKDGNGDWKFEFKDSDMELKKINFVNNRNYKLHEVVDNDLLYLFYPELKQYNVVFKNKKSGGSYDNEHKLIAVSSQKLNAPAEIKGTLIHEIQHAIQNIEGYSTGTTSKKGWFRYLNTLGEIEASDSKERYLKGYKGIPESAKNNPVHPIIKNSNNIIEKIGNSIYNYFNGGLNYGKENKSNSEENHFRNSTMVELGEGRVNIKESENNSGSFSMDNQGRTLTKEQQEYFKDSKIKDRNGLLMTVYHGTNNDFNIFDKQYVSKNTKNAGFYGDGFYFTPDKESARQYGKSSKEVYLDIKNPFSFSELSKYNGEDYYSDYVQIKNLVELNSEWGNIPVKFNDKNTWGDIYEDVKAMLEGNKTDEEIDNLMYDKYGEISEKINDRLYNYSKRNNYKTLSRVLEENGYDGIINRETPENSTEIVAFNSNQIKNIDNTNPTSNPNIRYSQNNKTWQQYLDENYKPTGTRTSMQDILPTAQDIYKMNNKEKVELLTDEDYEVLNKIYEKEGKTEILTEKKKANLLEKYANDKYAIKDSLDILKQKFINKGHYIDQLAEKTNNLELKFIYDKNLNSFAEGQYVVGVAQTDNKGNEIGKSINEIWEPIENSNLTKEFSEYLLHKHNIDRSERGKYIFGEEIGAAESTSIALELEKKYPEFKKYAEDIKKFNHNNLMNLKEAGMLTQDTIDYIEAMYPNYIAISRNLEEKLYTGGNEKTGAVSPLKKAVGGNSDIQPIKDTMAQQAIKIKRLVNQNELGKELSKTLKDAQVDEGVDIELSPTLLLDIDTMVDTDNQGNKYYLYFENGKQIKLKINDNLYESLKPTEISKLEKTFPVKALQKVTSIHRSLLTSSNPIFVVTNFFKDFQDGAFNSRYSSKFIKNYGKALNEIITNGKYYQSYMANGGMTNTYFDYNEGIKKHNKFAQKIRNINEIVEQLPRMAEFISTLEDGKSLNEALYNAAEITTNFKRGGDIAKVLNRNGVNFLNASIQGLDKQFRNFSGQNGAKGYANLLAKATIMSIIPSVLNHMLLDDDDDYQDLPQSTKDLYYLFKYDDGKFIRIPKGRVLSIFGAAARRTIETVQGQEDAWEGFGETIINQVAPNNPLEDNILAPISQVKDNKTWYGGDLVSSRLQEELPENQYDETTDEFSKWLGKQIKISPKKINYLIDQYSGGIGDVILPMITPQAKQNVLMDKFTTDSVLKNKNVSKFYETLEKQTQIANDSFATDEDQLQLKYLNSISRNMSDLYKQKREIQMSNISNTEKTRQVKAIQSKINELAEKGLTNYSNVNKTNNSSKIGDEEYYKDSKGNWTTIDEEEKAKIGDLSLDIYSEYKQKVYEKTQEKKSSGELTQNQTLKDKDKIQILLNSKYSDKDITSIYESQIKSTKDTQYDIIRKSGIDIKEYLKYKQQEFESDKKDDGTTTGKTVSGSKKKKVYNYVNSMNITYNQKLLLLGMQYSLTNTERTKLANYVNSMNLKKQEKLDIYEKLSGFTVYKNGKVTW